MRPSSSVRATPRTRLGLGLAALLPAVAACSPEAPRSPDGAGELRVAAAASLREAVTEAAARFEAETGVEVVLDLGGSGRLAAQVEAGAPFDVLLSAGTAEVDRLVAGGHVGRDAVTAPWSNRLVVVVPAGTEPPADVAALADPRFDHVAIGNPASVPAGRYAREWLLATGAWEALAGRIVPCGDVRAVLAAVETGAAQAGVVYRTDAAVSSRVDVAFEASGAAAPSIDYAAAVLANAPHPETAARFLVFLGEPGARAAFEGRGFVVRGSGAPGPATPPFPMERPGVLAPLLVSLKVALCATAAVFLPGVLVGLLLARRSFPGKAAVETLVELPLVLPPTAVGFALLALLGDGGPLSGLEDAAGILFTWRGAVVAAAVMALPLVARGARIAFDAVDPRLETMAASLGMSPWRVRAAVTLPLAWRGLLAAALLGFGRALGEFGATTLVAGNAPGRTQTLALAIYDDWHARDLERARLLLLVSVLVAFAAVATVGWLQRRDARLRGEA